MGKNPMALIPTIEKAYLHIEACISLDLEAFVIVLL